MALRIKEITCENEFPDIVSVDLLDGEGQVVDNLDYVPELTCKNLATRKDGFACSNCGCGVVGQMLDDFGSFNNPLLFSNCPNCFAKVVH